MKCYRSKLEWGDLIILLLALILMMVVMTRCTLYFKSYEEVIADAWHRKIDVHKYRIVPYQNNLRKPAVEHFKYVMSKIQGTNYLYLRTSIAKRIHATYLATIWVYYEKNTE